MARLEGKVAIISGSGRGIGQAVAIRLAREGARVVVNDLDDAPAEETVAAIKALGGDAIACVGNVAAPDFGEVFVGAALANFGALDIIVNNAGYNNDGMIQNQTDAQFQEMIDVHVTAPFRILRAASEHWRVMAKREAAEGREVIRKVVNVSSVAGTQGNAGQVSYSSAKAAIVGMTKTLSKEWGRLKVCVNCVAFGLVETRLTKPNTEIESRFEIEGRKIKMGLPPAILDSLQTLVPLGRLGSVEEAAGSIYFLCSPDSDYVSGQVLLVTGGASF
ncbi:MULTISPECIES: SDR family NAD(P)-dependent oxidoreductase [unclassified Sphingomonas]|uniref:SDR family NAD(P)-dependent oxidoreductase n=1 Tax=unclassified Sphingomonas TaxID=196159 RepID=UPI0009296F92|nr:MULTISPECIES: SDR family NAD(P)-dependent oxidoreductase [unclassified Sphingomonas]MBN8848505.1 SDR family oxidoreductase [Sphingomonas sp.]OJV32282.1 MAG: 3-oxoacyl-ACP reductase [Sphingomonas sp. 67-36]